MMMTKIENQVRYVTNVDGKTTDVLVPLELWQQLINSINSDHISGLAWIDEQEPKAQILADLQESIAQVAAGGKLSQFQSFGTILTLNIYGRSLLYINFI